MSFDRVLDDYRRRAGLPPSDRPQQRTRKATRKLIAEEDAVVASRSQLYRIHRILQLVETRAAEGAQHGSSEQDRRRFAEILKLVGGQRLTEASEPTSEFDTQLYLANDESLGMEEPMEIDVRVEYRVEPTEYEGPFVFYQGGVAIESIQIARPFEFMGRQFSAGEPFPKELLRYLVDPGGKSIFTSGGRDPWGDLESYVAERLHTYGDVKIPQRRYPDSRAR